MGSLDSTTVLVLQKAPERKVGRNQCHMCFVVSVVDEAVGQIVDLGGSRVSNPRTDGGVTVADSEGNKFC